ncbi:hypothetical protein FXO38_25174 [Capsicum annuum]|nr:hypothetical protein FXO38_25174 [Capsicum annuum]
MKKQTKILDLKHFPNQPPLLSPSSFSPNLSKPPFLTIFQSKIPISSLAITNAGHDEENREPPSTNRRGTIAMQLARPATSVASHRVSNPSTDHYPPQLSLVGGSCTRRNPPTSRSFDKDEHLVWLISDFPWLRSS